MAGCDANALFKSELKELGVSGVRDLPLEKILELAHRYAIWIPEATVSEAPWLAPYALRKIRNRTEPHAPGAVRDLWGTPTPDGYFTDDNSLVKPVVLRRALTMADSPYGNSPVTRGLICCHIWAGTTTDPLLFSFIPNLVWLPSDLAGLTDAHGSGTPHPLHDFLKVVSRERFGSTILKADASRVDRAWSSLPAPNKPIAQLDFGPYNELADPSSLTKLLVGRVRKLVTFLDGTLSSGPMPKRFSKRYHAGVGPGIDATVWPIQNFVGIETRAELALEMRSCVGSLEI